MDKVQLSRVERLPIDTIKIDRTFVNHVAAGGNGEGIIPAIVALAHELNLDVVAEGIETEAQSAVVRGLHCEYGHCAPTLSLENTTRVRTDSQSIWASDELDLERFDDLQIALAENLNIHCATIAEQAV
ncbi:MAG: EAL domain-containing protein [Chloroflexi bacterium]|nr:EAL domain-containing protein [Chloroflexota bacterium]